MQHKKNEKKDFVAAYLSYDFAVMGYEELGQLDKAKEMRKFAEDLKTASSKIMPDFFERAVYVLSSLI